MSNERYRIIAVLPPHRRAQLPEVRRALQRSFGLDPLAIDAVLAGSGLIVGAVATLRDAQLVAHQVTGAGADYRVVDRDEAVVEEGSAEVAMGNSAVAETDIAPDLSPGGPVGAGTLIGGFSAWSAPEAAAPPPADSPHDEAPPLLSAAAQVLAPLDAQLVEHASLVPAENATAEALDGSRGLDAVDADELVLLDGTKADDLPAASLGPGHGSGQALRAPRSDEPIELDDPYSRPPAEEEPAEVSEPKAAVRRVGNARRTPVGALFGGRLRDYPRLRVALGFALAVALGSVLPMCQAHWARQGRIHELRVDLATAKAYRAAGVHGAGEEDPAQVADRLSGVTFRYAAYGFLLWTAVAAGLLALWFRFT